MEKLFESFESELVKCEKFKCHKIRTKKLLINTKRNSYRNDIEILASQYCKFESSERKSAKTFLKSNYKYKRRNLVLSDDANNDNYRNLIANGISEIFKFDYFKNASRHVRCVKMLSNCPLSILIIAIIIILGFADVTEAGICWLKREENGKCAHMYSSNMSAEECCKHSNFAYTEKEMSDIELFFATAIDEGAVCRSCLDSCEAAKCGLDKRCVYRKGRAKCVCAPVCRSSKKNKPKIGPRSSTTTTILPALAQRNEKLSFFNFDQIFDREINMNKNYSNSTSINNNENSEPRWRRGTSQDSINENSNQNETESSTAGKFRKNQRKSNLSKRRKHHRQKTTEATFTSLSSVVSLSPIDDVEQIPNPAGFQQSQSQKSDKIIIVAKSPETAISKTIVSDQSSSFQLSEKNSNLQQHHNRHQYKKHQQRKPKQNATKAINQRIHQSSSLIISLDEKIRNGFFNHGFPYPTVDSPQMAHGRYYNPVCGTDGKTYKTECQLKKRACRRESTTLVVAYRGHCHTSCKLVRCLNNLTCVEDQYGIPHCISCSITCPQDDISSVIDLAKAVCGVDGLTYKSVCDINRLICTTGRSISVAYYGPCQEEANCNNIQCRDKQVCLNDLVTSKSRCISCSFKCPRKRRPQGQRYQEHKICGTNNLTYHSWCQMRRDSCNTGFYIDVKHVGPCHKSKLPDSVSLNPKYT